MDAVSCLAIIVNRPFVLPSDTKVLRLRLLSKTAPGSKVFFDGKIQLLLQHHQQMIKRLLLEIILKLPLSNVVHLMPI
jgi:hypothetical protein